MERKQRQAMFIVGVSAAVVAAVGVVVLVVSAWSWRAADQAKQRADERELREAVEQMKAREFRQPRQLNRSSE